VPDAVTLPARAWKLVIFAVNERFAGLAPFAFADGATNAVKANAAMVIATSFRMVSSLESFFVPGLFRGLPVGAAAQSAGELD
jgi:hypothetical protein